jgi:hypothetical protein
MGDIDFSWLWYWWHWKAYFLSFPCICRTFKSKVGRVLSINLKVKWSWTPSWIWSQTLDFQIELFLLLDGFHVRMKVGWVVDARPAAAKAARLMRVIAAGPPAAIGFKWSACGTASPQNLGNPCSVVPACAPYVNPLWPRASGRCVCLHACCHHRQP